MTGYLLSRSVPVQKNWFSQTIHSCKALAFYLGGGGCYSVKHISPAMTSKCQWVELNKTEARYRHYHICCVGRKVKNEIIKQTINLHNTLPVKFNESNADIPR